MFMTDATLNDSDVKFLTGNSLHSISEAYIVKIAIYKKNNIYCQNIVTWTNLSIK